MTEPHPLNGRAIFGKLKDIDRIASDLVVVDRELKALIGEIERGEYDSSAISAEQIIEKAINYLALEHRTTSAQKALDLLLEFRAERER